jgi:hypothetical protein
LALWLGGLVECWSAVCAWLLLEQIVPKGPCYALVISILLLLLRPCLCVVWCVPLCAGYQKHLRSFNWSVSVVKVSSSSSSHVHTACISMHSVHSMNPAKTVTTFVLHHGVAASCNWSPAKGRE